VQRSPLNTQCKRLLLAHAFEQLDCIAVEFRTHRLNTQSRRAIERLGAQLDGILRSHQISPNGTLRDTAVYSITAAEWPTVRPTWTGSWPSHADALPTFAGSTPALPVFHMAKKKTLDVDTLWKHRAHRQRPACRPTARRRWLPSRVIRWTTTAAPARCGCCPRWAASRVR
jgi:hypothetical protein